MTKLAVYRPEGAPAFRPHGWDSLRRDYNCYSYALRLSAHGWGVPGLLKTGADSHGSFTVELMGERLKQDGLEPILEHGADPEKHHIVAAFVRSVANEFHFYSLDADKHWSHKRGGTGVTRLDAAFRAISDPRIAEAQCDLGNNTDFAGFYRVRDEGITYLADPEQARRFNLALRNTRRYNK